MVNEEMKKKISGIIGDVYLVNAPIKDVFKPIFIEKIADDLILSVIGDAIELQKECDSKEEAYNKCYFDYKHWKDKAEEYKHRAEVAERELSVYKEMAGAMLCEIDCANEGYCPELYKDPECQNCTQKKIYGNSAATFPCLLNKYKKQAEQELQEERNELP